jgi:peptidoglycan hydrolase CwlO-like protein
MESGNLPPDPTAAAEKKFKIAATLAAILGIAAIGFAVWAFSLNSDAKNDEKELAGADSAESVDQQRIEAAKAKYAAIKAKLSSSETTDDELQDEIAQLKKEVDTAKANEEDAESADQKETATANSLEKQLALAQACAQAAIRSANTLTDESADDAGLSAIEGTIAKLTTVTSDCQAVVN